MAKERETYGKENVQIILDFKMSRNKTETDAKIKSEAFSDQAMNRKRLK